MKTNDDLPAVSLDKEELVALFLLHAMALVHPKDAWNDLAVEAIDGAAVFLEALEKIRSN